MDCPTEEAVLRKALERLPGVQSLEFNLMERTLKVEHELKSIEPILSAIRGVEMTAVPQLSDAATSTDPVVASPTITRRQWILMAVAGAAAFASEALAYATGNETSIGVG